MIWKPKEKELTLDEAVAQAKQQLAPYWFGISPQFAVVPAATASSPNALAIFPLNSNFLNESWLILFLDPTGFSGEMTLELATEFQKLYAPLELKVLVISISTYSFLKDLKLFRRFIDQWSAKYFVMLDSDGSLTLALSVKELPKSVVLFQSQRQIELEGESVFRDLELQLQGYFRKTDPGLPLYPPYVLHLSHVRDVGRVEFGYRPNFGLPYAFKGEGFKPLEKAEPGIFAAFYGALQQTEINLIRAGEVLLTGNWTQDSERIMTADSSATLSFLSPSAEVGLVAQSLSTSIDRVQIEIESGGAALLETTVGQDTVLDDLGRSFVRIKDPALYRIAVGLKSGLRFITLRMKNADRVPLALYGLRFGE